MSKYTISYDNITDVLYIITKKIKATQIVLDDNFIAIRKKDDEICGITIDGYKHRHIDKSWKNDFITKYIPDFDLKILPPLKQLQDNKI